MPARLKIDFFTPLPPARTEIGNHSAALLPALAERAEVTAWTDQEAWEDVPGVSVRRFDAAHAPFREMNKADATFYNIGNNATFHKGIYQVARRSPGVVILHDTNLQNFFAHWGVSDGPGAALYLDAMRRWHGPDAALDGRRLIDGALPIEALMPRYPLTLAAAEGAVGIVVHNDAECRRLAAATRLPVYSLPLAFDLRQVPPPVSRERRGPPWRLVVFGFIGGNRRLPGILRALAAAAERDLFTLDLYGTLEDPQEVDALVEELGLGARVAQHGFVPRDALEAALARADLALNLRHPTMGEASASQLRIWAHALPALVSRAGWYATLPGDTVFHVDPSREVEDVQAHLAAFVRDQEPFLAAGRRGREQLLALHGTETYAAALLRIAEEAAMCHGRRMAIDMAAAAARGLLQLAAADDGASELLVPPVAEHIAALSASRPQQPARP